MRTLSSGRQREITRSTCAMAPICCATTVVAQQIGAIAQVDRVISRCLPEDKVRIVKELEQQGHRVLMVGDGINDAPALATATVGMALGTQGLTAAASAADTVLLSTDILRVARAVRLGHRRSAERRVGEECRSRW